MNYCEIHLGDLEKATAHLTGVEDGMYWRLMRWYYDAETPLPLDLKAIQRKARARTREEREAVETVLQEFFVQQADGWHQKRCDEEIAKFQSKKATQAEGRESEAGRKRRYRQRRAELFEQLREIGIVPEFDTSMSQLERLLSRGTSEGQGQGQDGDGTATQSPVTSHQSPDILVSSFSSPRLSAFYAFGLNMNGT